MNWVSKFKVTYRDGSAVKSVVLTAADEMAARNEFGSSGVSSDAVISIESLDNRPVWMEVKKSSLPMVGIGTAGFFVGGLIGFLARPSVFLIGQLPFGVVISRGANLRGADTLLVPMAQQSFNFMLNGAIVGLIVGVVIGYFVEQKKTT